MPGLARPFTAEGPLGFTANTGVATNRKATMKAKTEILVISFISISPPLK